MDGAMTREQLRTRCVALAGVGDVQAAATLEILGELGRLEEQASRKEPAQTPHAAENEKLKKTVADLTYVLDKIRMTMTLADSLLRGATLTNDTTTQGALDDVDKMFRETKETKEPSPAVRDHIKRLLQQDQQRQVLAREAALAGFGAEVVADAARQPLPVPVSLPDGADAEAEGIRHLRETMNLPPVPDPAVTQCNPTGPAGHWDSKDGNKGE